MEIEWDEGSIEHIAAHRVQPHEVEAVLRGKHLLVKGRRRRYYVLGQTEAGRYLFVVLGQKRSGRFRVITAREMTQAERRRFRRRMRSHG